MATATALIFAFCQEPEDHQTVAALTSSTDAPKSIQDQLDVVAGEGVDRDEGDDQARRGVVAAVQ